MMQSFKTQVSSSPPTIRKRYHEFDLLRGISILFMVACHVLETYNSFIAEHVLTEIHWIYYSYAVIGPSALMIALGANLAFSHNHSPSKLIKRGLTFLLLDFGLNIVRTVVPCVACTSLGYDGYMSYAFCEILRSDIYAFVGAFFLLFALFTHLRLGPFVILNITILMTGFNTAIEYFHLLPVNNVYLSAFLSRFFWMDDSSFFSLFSWSIFPAIGYYFGKHFQQLNAAGQRQLAYRMLSICSTVFISFLIFLANRGYSLDIASLPLNDYKTDPFGAILMILLTGIVWSLLHLFVSRFPNCSFTKPILVLSKHVVPYYLIQWIIILWLCYPLELVCNRILFHSTLSFYLFVLLIIISSIGLSILISKKMSVRKQKPVQSHLG